MNGAVLLVIGCACFLLAFLFYSKFIGRVLGLDPSIPTPAHTMKDGVDYVPAHPAVLFGHHFAAIAGAGPIVGPVLAAEFGWGAVALWIIFGCIFIGAAHDMITLFLSVRHKGQSIGTVIGDVLGRPGKILFLIFCWTTLILVCAEFTRQIAATFVMQPGIATASVLFIGEAVLFGLCIYRFHVSVLVGSLVFVPLVFASVWIGGIFPIDLLPSFGGVSAPEYVKLVASGAAIPAVTATAALHTQVVWTIVLLVYCFLASTLPVWLLLQPRDYLNAYLLYAMMILGFLGILFAHPSLQMDTFTGLSTALGRSGKLEYLFPFLFVTVACGACSGFHATVASGTTAKQLDSEKHIRLIGYGGMLLEGVLATIAVIGVAGTFTQSGYSAAIHAREPVQLFASTIAGFCHTLGIPVQIAESFMLLAVSAFLMTSVDAATRLARFTWQELFVPQAQAGDEGQSKITGWRVVPHNMYFGTAVVVGVVAMLLIGNPKAAKSLWTTFASANQMLAALTLLTASLWLLKNHRNFWIAILPMFFMLFTSGTAVVEMFLQNFQSWMQKGFAAGGITAIMALFLFCLCVTLVFFGVFCLRKIIRSRITDSYRRMAKE